MLGCGEGAALPGPRGTGEAEGAGREHRTEGLKAPEGQQRGEKGRLNKTRERGRKPVASPMAGRGSLG